MRLKAFAAAALVAGCSTFGGDTTPEQDALAFCTGYKNALIKSTIMLNAGVFPEAGHDPLRHTIAVVGPYCKAENPPTSPTTDMLTALDSLLIAIATAEGN